MEVEGLPAPAGSPIGHRVRSSGTGLGYFDAFGSRILAGRGFQPADADTASTAVIVSEAFVQQVLGGGNALGRRLRFAAEPDRAGADTARPGRWFEIVGVSADLQVNPIDPTLVRPAVWYAVAPSQAHLAQWVDVEVRLRRPTAAADFVPKLRRIAAAVDPALRLGRASPWSSSRRRASSRFAWLGWLGLVIVSVFLLSAAGVYALTSFTVTRRRREIGIRSALGAHPRQVLLGVFAGVARQVALGLALGIATAVAVEMSSGGELMGGRGLSSSPSSGRSWPSLRSWARWVRRGAGSGSRRPKRSAPTRKYVWKTVKVSAGTCGVTAANTQRYRPVRSVVILRRQPKDPIVPAGACIRRMRILRLTAQDDKSA